MNDTLDSFVLFVKFTVDVPLSIPLRPIAFLHRTSIFNIILFQIFPVGNQSWCKRSAQEKCLGILRVPDGNVSIGVDHFMVMQDMVGSYEGAE